jgi:hypothetical protein
MEAINVLAEVDWKKKRDESSLAAGTGMHTQGDLMRERD